MKKQIQIINNYASQNYKKKTNFFLCCSLKKLPLKLFLDFAPEIKKSIVGISSD